MIKCILHDITISYIFLDHLGVLQRLPYKDAEVYHQLKKNIGTFHWLPSQLAAQLTFELLLHRVFD